MGQMNRVVVATATYNHLPSLTLLYPQGQDLVDEVESFRYLCTTRFPDQGIVVWEGEREVLWEDPEGEENTDYQFNGTVRPLTDAEWECLRRGVTPFPPESDGREPT